MHLDSSRGLGFVARICRISSWPAVSDVDGNIWADPRQCEDASSSRPSGTGAGISPLGGSQIVIDAVTAGDSLFVARASGGALFKVRLGPVLPEANSRRFTCRKEMLGRSSY